MFCIAPIVDILFVIEFRVVGEQPCGQAEHQTTQFAEQRKRGCSREE